MTTLTSEPASAEKIIHDLRGPLFNIAGFQSELQEAFQQLQEMFDQYCDKLPESHQEEFRNLFKDDIDHCLTYTSKSIDSLGERIDALEERLKRAA